MKTFDEIINKAYKDHPTNWVKEAMKEACRMVLDEAAEKGKTLVLDEYNVVVDKESILKIKDELK